MSAQRQSSQEKKSVKFQEDSLAEREMSSSGAEGAAASNNVVQIPVTDLKKLIEEVMDAKLPGKAPSGPKMMMSMSRSTSAEYEEGNAPGSPNTNLPIKRMQKTSSTASVSSSEEFDSTDSLLRGGSGSMEYGGSSSPRSQLTGDDYGDSSYIYDCDPRAWILAAGRLEKKRDGNWKAGWGKRFFILTSSTLYYYLVPKRGGKGETNSLLGDERGQIRVSDIQNVRTIDAEEGNMIFLNCDDIKKNSITQSSNRSIVLRAQTPAVARKWCDLLLKAREIHKQANDRIRYGGGKLLEGFVPHSTYKEFSSIGMDSRPLSDAIASSPLRSSIYREIMPLLKSGSNVVLADANKATHIDPYFALAALVGLNGFCYLGPALNEFSVWMIANFAFLSFVMYYEKLANEHDASVFRYNRAIKKLQSTSDRVMHALKNILGEEVVEEEVLTAPSSPGSVRSPKSAAESSTMSPTASSETSSAQEAPSGGQGKSGKTVGGLTMAHAGEREDMDCSWSVCPGNIFKLRDLEYKVKKQKKPSADPLYEVVGMDILKGDNKIENVHQFVDLPPPRSDDDLDLIKKSGLPRIFIVNIQVPLKPPSPWGAEDPGVSIVFYFALRPETALAAAENHDRAEVKLLKRFVDDFETDDDIRRRFKGIGIAANFEDLGLSSRLESLNGKPVILFKSALVQRGQDCIEVNVMVHKFGVIARTLFNQFKEKAPEVKIRGGFLIQGEEDSELPECLLGCAKIHNLDFSRAVHIRDLLLNGGK